MFRFIKTAAFGAAIAATPALAQDYRAAIAATNPVASFQLDAPNATASIGGYSTTWQNVAQGTGAPLASVPGNRGASFDGTGDTSMITTGLAGMTPGRGSINMWVNLSQLPSLAGRIFYLAGESQFGNDFDFQLAQNNNLSLCVGAGGGQCFETQGADASWLGQWHMVTAAYNGTIDGGLDTQAIFIDGAQVAFRNADLSNAGHSSNFTIGYSSAFGGREYAGLIDEVGVWDRALNASEVRGLYASRLNGGAIGPVPEPATWATMLAGFGLIGFGMRRRPRVAISA